MFYPLSHSLSICFSICLQLKISFNESSLHSTYEYPSEKSVWDSSEEEEDEDRAGEEEEQPSMVGRIHIPRPTFTTSPAHKSNGNGETLRNPGLGPGGGRCCCRLAARGRAGWCVWAGAACAHQDAKVNMWVLICRRCSLSLQLEVSGALGEDSMFALTVQTLPASVAA